MRQRIVVWLILLAGGLVLSLLLDVWLFPSWFRSPFFHLSTFFPGALLMYGVLRVSRNTGQWLAREGRVGDLPRMETNRLVTTGPYTCMRHPMHFGLLFFPMSIALLAGSPTFIIIVAPVEAIFILLMLKIYEEPEAIEKFGEAYILYRQNVPMFNFSPGCLRQLFTASLDGKRPMSSKSI